MSAVRIGALEELPDGGTRRAELDGRAVAVVRLGDRVYAIGDTCSHAEVSLSGGEVDPDDCTLECPKHGSAFDLRTGEPCSLPAVRPVPVYEVELRDDGVYLLATDPPGDEDRD